MVVDCSSVAKGVLRTRLAMLDQWEEKSRFLSHVYFFALTPVSHRPTENCHSEIFLADELRPEFLHCSLSLRFLLSMIGQPLQFTHTNGRMGSPTADQHCDF